MGKTVSIDIGNHALHIVEGSAGKFSAIINKAVTVPLSEGIIDDGIIVSLPQLNEAMRDALKQHGFSPKNVIFTFGSSNSITVRDVELPAVSKRVLNRMARIEMENTFSIPKTAVMQFKLLPNASVENKDKKAQRVQRVRAIAVPDRVVHDFFDLARSQQLNPIALDVQASAISALINKSIKINGETPGNAPVMLLDIGSEIIQTHLIQNGNVTFSRALSMGMCDISRAMENTTAMPSEQIKLFEQNLLMENRESSEDAMTDLVNSLIYHWCDEIIKVTRFFAKGNHEIATQIYAFGGGSRLKGLLPVMESFLKIPVRPLESLSTVIWKVKEEGHDDVYNYINAAGAMVGR